jgi:hypothetical protein
MFSIASRPLSLLPRPLLPRLSQVLHARRFFIFISWGTDFILLVLGQGAFGVVQLLEDPSTHDLIAVKFFDSETTKASDRSSAFFREIDALVFLTHPCVLRIAGYCLSPLDT